MQHNLVAMATQESERIVAGDESEIHDEPPSGEAG
jgi:hypothetical protein